MSIIRNYILYNPFHFSTEKKGLNGDGEVWIKNAPHRLSYTGGPLIKRPARSNVLRYAGLMEKEIKKNPNRVKVDRIILVRAVEGRILQHSVELGTWLKGGDEIAIVEESQRWNEFK